MENSQENEVSNTNIPSTDPTLEQTVGKSMQIP